MTADLAPLPDRQKPPPPRWAVVTVADLLHSGVIRAHKDGNHGSNYPRAAEFSDKGIPFLTAKLLDDGHTDIDSAPRLPDERADSLRIGFVQPGDVLLSHNATIGRVAVVPAYTGRLLIGTSLTYFRLDKTRLIPNYLAAFFRGAYFQNQLKAFMSHSTRNQVPITAQRHLQIVVPPVEEQLAITSILDAFDDHIDLLRQTNATLEAIAQALFKSWFVDFDPVHAKVEGREPEAMGAATAALFTSEFEASELGLIPKGWRATTLREAFEINPRRPLRKGAPAPYLDMASVPTSGHVPTPPADREFSSGTKFQNGDTLLARITPCLENGKTAHVDFLDDGQIGWGSTEFIVLRPKAPLTPYFGYLLARQRDFRAFAIQAMTGTSGRQRVELGQLDQFLLTIPDEAVAAAFGSFVEPIRKAISANADRAAALSALRDTLLPRLISGKLRLPKGTEVAEECVA